MFKFLHILATSLKKARAGLSALSLVLQCYGFLFIMDMKEVLKAAFLVSELKVPSFCSVCFNLNICHG